MPPQFFNVNDFSDKAGLQTFAITCRSYRLKDRATFAGKEDKNKRTKSKSNEHLPAEPAS